MDCPRRQKPSCREFNPPIGAYTDRSLVKHRFSVLVAVDDDLRVSLLEYIPERLTYRTRWTSGEYHVLSIRSRTKTVPELLVMVDSRHVSLTSPRRSTQSGGGSLLPCLRCCGVADADGDTTVARVTAGGIASLAIDGTFVDEIGNRVVAVAYSQCTARTVIERK